MMERRYEMVNTKNEMEMCLWWRVFTHFSLLVVRVLRPREPRCSD